MYVGTYYELKAMYTVFTFELLQLKQNANNILDIKLQF